MYIPSLKTDVKGVPVLSKEQIDIIAERFIADFCPEALREPQPIDIDSFVLNYLKLKQDFQYLSHCGLFLGMMVFNDTRKVVVYNPMSNRAEYIAAREGTVIIDNILLAQDQEKRYRFTMGHEGSHWICHRNVFWRDPYQTSLFDSPGQAVVQCRAASIEGKSKPYHLWDYKDRMEWQANYMSSALLMPKSMVMSVYNEDWLREMIDNEDLFMRSMYKLSLIHAVAERFNVSIQAAEIRLKNLGLIEVSEDWAR